MDNKLFSHCECFGIVFKIYVVIDSKIIASWVGHNP